MIFTLRSRCCCVVICFVFFFFSSRRRHTRVRRDWSSDVCSSDLSAPRPTRKSRWKVQARNSILSFSVNGCHWRVASGTQLAYRNLMRHSPIPTRHSHQAPSRHHPCAAAHSVESAIWGTQTPHLSAFAWHRNGSRLAMG